ncbi:MAG: hypothetical protein ACRD3V_21950, partial [Vicinamibacteria bacterium]
LRKSGAVSSRFVSGADHVFTHAATQDELLSAISGWAGALRATDESALSEAQSPRAGRFSAAGP